MRLPRFGAGGSSLGEETSRAGTILLCSRCGAYFESKPIDGTIYIWCDLCRVRPWSEGEGPA